MAVPTSLAEALVLLTGASGNKITGQDVRDVITWLAGAGISEEQVEALIATALDGALDEAAVETLIATAASAAEAQALAYRSQATWYIDAENGDDDADGLTAETAIQTQAEWVRRVGDQPLVAMTVNVLSDSDEDMVWRVKNTPETLLTVLGAKSAPLYTGTVSAIQNHSSSQNVEGWITDSALPTATWAESGLLGKIVVLTSGQFTGFHYWMCSDLPTERTARFSRVNNGLGGMLQGTVAVGVTYTVHDLRTLSGKHVIEGGAIKFVDLELGSVSGGADQVRISGGDITFQNAKLYFPRIEFGARVTAHSSWLQDSGSTGVGIYDTADLAIYYTHATNGLTVHGSGRFYSHSLTTHGKIVLAGLGARLHVTNSCGFHDCVNALEMGEMTEASIMGRFWGTAVTGVGVTMAASARLFTYYPITIATPTTQAMVGGVPKLYSELPFLGVPDTSRSLTLAELKAIPAAARFDGMRVRVGSVTYSFDADNVSTADDQLVIAPTVGTGRYIADVGQIVDIRMPFTFATANNAVLYTVPSDWGTIMVLRGYWECSEAFSGGSGSTLGIDSDEFGLTTAGDIHGGAAGDSASWLGVGGGGDTFYPSGTPGTRLGAGPVVLSAGSSFQLNHITSAFTAGEGAFHAICMVMRPLVG